VEKLLLFSLAMSITSVLLTAGCVVACSRLASRCIRAQNRAPPSHATLSRLEADQVALSSSLESIAMTVKRMASRKAMQDFRQGASENAPPPGAPKAEVLRHYKLAGKTGPEFAKAQLELVTKE